MINTDKPINTSEEDKLERSEFVKRISKAICEFDSKDNFTIALQGIWGCGKTSILNMISKEIAVINEEITVVSFNPWNFTDGNQLVSQFFMNLSSELKNRKTNKTLKKIKKKDKYARIGELIDKYSYSLEYAEYIPVIGKYLKIVPKLASSFGSSLKEKNSANTQNIIYQKNVLINALNDIDSRILIIIDDIDRLPNEQIRLIFQLVSSVAGLPNITYLLSYDKEIVVRALHDVQTCNGEEYLEKIIQVAFDVPNPKKDKLYSVLIDRINSSIDIPENDLHSNYWHTVHKNCIAPYISSVRDINRYINMLEFSFLPIKSEISFIDMAALCSYRVFVPEIYKWIHNNKYSLVGGYIGSGIPQNDIQKSRDSYIELFNKISSRNSEILILGLSTIFPHFNNAVSYSSVWDTPLDLRKAKRIASDQRFDGYFSLSLEDIRISDQEFVLSINKMGESELRDYIEFLNKHSLITDYLSELRLYFNDIPEERIELLLSVLMFNSGRINTSKELNGYNDRILNIYYLIDFLKVMSNEKDRNEIIKNLLCKSDFESFEKLLHLFHVIELSYGKICKTEYESDSKLISSKDLENLEVLIIERIKTFAIKRNIFEWNEPKRGLLIWELLDQESYYEYVKEKIADPINALILASLSIGEWISGNIVTEYEIHSNQFYNYKSFLDDPTILRYLEIVKNEKRFWELEEYIIKRSIAFSLIKARNTTTMVNATDVDRAFDEWKTHYLRSNKIQALSAILGSKK